MHLLASPAGDFYRLDFEDRDHGNLDFGVEAGAGMPVGAFDVAARIYLPQLPDSVTGQGLGLDLRYCIE